MVHFQLTRKCNLHCAFCGQEHTPDHHLSVDWSGIMHQLTDYAPGCRIVLWGGEPLLYPGFDELCRQAKQLGFSLELITNGTLIANHIDILRTAFEHIYISVDGPKNIHDDIRGKGVFETVSTNIDLLQGGYAKLSIMSVLSPQTLPYAKEAPYGLHVDNVILHELIGFTAEERQSVPDASTWPELPPDYHSMVLETILALNKQTFPVPVEFQPHFAGGVSCREPYRHLHIRENGETGFCTDFFSKESLGNVHQESVRSIFEGERAKRFRLQHETFFCSRCSWKNTEESIIKFSMS